MTHSLIEWWGVMRRYCPATIEVMCCSRRVPNLQAWIKYRHWCGNGVSELCQIFVSLGMVSSFTLILEQMRMDYGQIFLHIMHSPQVWGGYVYISCELSMKYLSGRFLNFIPFSCIILHLYSIVTLKKMYSVKRWFQHDFIKDCSLMIIEFPLPIKE